MGLISLLRTGENSKNRRRKQKTNQQPNYHTLEPRLLLAADADDQRHEARALGDIQQVVQVSDAISVPEDVDMFRFQGEEGQIVSLDIDTATNGVPGLGSYLRLFTWSGNQLAANNDAAAPGEELGFDSYIRYELPSDGNYLVAVSNWQNRNFDPIDGTGDTIGDDHLTGPYQLIVSAEYTPSADPDDQLSEVSSGPNHMYAANGDKLRDGEIDNPYDVDMYSFRVNEDQRVAIDIDSAISEMFGAYIRLFDDSGDVLAVNNDGAAPGEENSFDSYLEYTFDDAGLYFVGVSHWRNTSYSPTDGDGDRTSDLYATGNYRIIVGDPNDQIIEANDLGILTNEKTTSDSIDIFRDVDMYAFETKPFQRVAFDIDGAENIDLRLFNETGQEISVNWRTSTLREDTRERFGEHFFLDGGVYYIGVSGHNNTSYSATTGWGDTNGSQAGEYTFVVTPITTIDSPGVSVRTVTGELRMANRNNHLASAEIFMRRLGPNGQGFSQVQNRPTWVVIHGRTDNSNNFRNLAGQIYRDQPSDQVVVLDWSPSAHDNTGFSDVSLNGAEWIPNVAKWTKDTLASFGIQNQPIYLVGHSWGSYVAYEISRRIAGGVEAIVALDPARNAWGYPAANVNFQTHSRLSWAFYGEGSYGSAALSARADEAFTLKYRTGGLFDPGPYHSAPVRLFEQLVGNNAAGQNFFELSRLKSGQRANFRTNQYAGGSNTEDPRRVFEGLFFLEEPGGNVNFFRYTDASGAERTVRS